MPMDMTCLSDAELVHSLKTLARDERRQIVSVLKRLAAKEGFPSLFDYCVRELRYAED